VGTAVGGLVEVSAAAGVDTRVLLVRDAAGAGYQVAGPRWGGERNDPIVVTSSWADAYDIALDLIHDWQPHVVHLHVFWLWPIVGALQHETGIPVVYTVHSLDRAENELGDGPPECLTQWETQAAAIGGADRIVALSRHEQELIGSYCPAARDRVRVVGNGINPRADLPRTPSGGEDMTVLFTGRLPVRAAGFKALFVRAAPGRRRWSRWSARSEARTNDLDPPESRCMLAMGRGWKVRRRPALPGCSTTMSSATTSLIGYPPTIAGVRSHQCLEAVQHGCWRARILPELTATTVMCKWAVPTISLD